MTFPNWKPPSLSQPVDGYRYSADAFLLAGFAARFSPRFFCDLGTGSGVVAFALTRVSGASGVAIERDRLSCRHARQNLGDLPVSVIQSDLRYFPWRRQTFDMVLSNPPYFTLGQGRISQNQAVARARHAYFGTIVDFAARMAPTLSPGGVFCFIFPCDRVAPVLRALLQQGWFVRERLLIRSYEDRPPRLLCLALSRSPALPERVSELVMYHAHRHYTGAAVELLGDFGSEAVRAVSEM